MAQGLSPIPPRPQVNVYIDPDVPCYVVVEKRGFVDDQDRLWEKGSRIYWEGKPSLGLDPINEIAEEKMRDYLMELDKLADKVAQEKGTAHTSLTSAYEARRRIQELDRRYSSPDYDDSMPIMGAKKPAKGLSRSLEEGPAQVQVMGHRGRYQVAQQQKVQGQVTRGRPKKADSRDTNEGRSVVNGDDGN